MALKSKIHFQKSKKIRIFYPFPNLKMLENVLSSRFRGANGFNSSYGLDFFFHTLSRYSTTLKKLIWGTKAASKTFQVALKSKTHFQKSKNVRIFYVSPSLKMSKKYIEITFQRRKWFLYIIWCCAFLFDTLSGYRTMLQKLIWGPYAASKCFQMALKSNIYIQKSKHVSI